MKFTPKTEEEIKRAELCPEGVYPFTVLAGKERESKSAKNPGKLMFEVKLNIHASADFHCFDYFADWFSEYKLRHFAKATGLLAQYEKGELDANTFQTRTGYVKVTIKEGKNGYGPSNGIDDYLTEEEAKKEMTPQSAPAANKPATAQQRTPDDDVPF